MIVEAAVDPGLNGAVAVLGCTGELETAPLKRLGGGINQILDGGWLARFLEERKVDTLIIEKAQSMKGQGIKSTFDYGAAYGQMIGVGQAGGMRVGLAPPQRWKRAMDLWGIKNEAERKGAARRRATKLFPDYRGMFSEPKDEHRAEAALMIWWHQNGGEVIWL